MIKLAITGGLCSGKSTVSGMLRERGVPVVDADAISHHVLQGEAKAAVVEQFGPGIEGKDGRVVPERLAALVFAPGAHQALTALNKILHPRIIAEADRELRRFGSEGAAMAGVEAALFIEAGRLGGFDKVILVEAGVEERVRRFVARGSGTADQARGRMAHQWSDEEKARYADYIIENDGPLAATARQVEVMLARLQVEVSL
ncbi:MAG: dephospho-CoA kinase [Terriglobales bacterium]